MDLLFKGAIKFKEENFLAYKELFENLKDGQNPHTLFVGCADSRVVPNLITNTLPGELFVVRNIANIVPPYRKSKEYLATTSAIEYALEELQVENIIICGHSHCGGCAALYEEGNFQGMPNVQNWLKLIAPVKEQVLALKPKNDAMRAYLTEQINIERQIRNLFTYPQVKEKYLARTLKIYGWYYIIECGEVYSYDFKMQEFNLLKG
ncbi:carbonic anhydrase [Helicobacter sp.]|uniref:carbonic anhydrase n=1 Tax=Helicobacter sp. TaxID=218 RepID=UPI0025C5A5AC|nr:carbonic anhydrase [Helicobacter sp.]MCI5969061.1 carbonic anhydrase [Helicobacter sp.]MDY2585358.1 carbonic anhydrase [Helicobacter sp.]